MRLSNGQLALAAKAASGAPMLNKLSPTDTIEMAQADQGFGLNAAQGFDLHEAISFVWRQWKIIASIAAIALLIGVIVTMTQTPRYTRHRTGSA